ncbi:hypothetical protein ACFU5O_31935 [Streptomyces sp. NPDC057445]|uniref:hypothetical protein n=1 Tax=Streptomyces sp. NPDC057445 TaxID=3346136 RepID=UPI003679D033
MATETDTSAGGEKKEELFPVPSLSALSGLSGRKQRKPAQDREAEIEAVKADAGEGTRPAGQPLDDEIRHEVDEAPIPRARRRRPKATTRQPAQPTEADTLPVTFQVSEGVRRRLDRTQAQVLTNERKRKGHLDIILESLDAAAQAGWDVVIKASVPERPKTRFGSSRPLKDRDYAGTGSQSLYTRMTPELVEELDRAVEEAKVPDRNKLVAMCLNWHLPGRSDKPSGTS